MDTSLPVLQSSETAGEHQLSKPLPDEFQTIENSVLVYTSDEGETVAEDLQNEGCAGERDFTLEGIDTSPYIEVLFKRDRRGFFLNKTGTQLEPTQYVIVQAEKGVDIGMVNCTGDTAYMKSLLRNKPCQGEELLEIIKPAVPEDVETYLSHRVEETKAFDVCMEKIVKLELPMKLVDVEFQFDRNRITFYFTADGRVDFRNLVKELASVYRTRIELRQIGPRDEARRFGGLGNCGRDLCCASWLGTFEPISTGMAKMQNLTMNPFKLAGQCGRLKCCLAFESQVYEELLKKFPPMEARIQTSKGIGRIEKIDIFQDAVYLYHEKNDIWEKLTLEDVKKLPPSAIVNA